MFRVEVVLPHDDRDVVAYDPKMGLVIACYLENSNKWIHGYEPLYEKAGIAHEFNPTHWYYLECRKPDSDIDS